MAQSNGRRVWVPALGVLLLALLVRAGLCARPVCISPDGVHYVSFARQLADDPVRWMRVTSKQPGYAWLLLGVHRLAGDLFGGDTPIAWQRCGQGIALAGGLATCVAVYFLTRRLYDDRTAALAGLLAALWPQGAWLSAGVLSDMPHLALYLFGLLAAFRAAARPRRATLALCGLLAGAAYLLRQEALGLLAGALVCLWWFAPWSPPREKYTGVAVVLICFAVVVSPYCLAMGTIMPNKSPDDLFSLQRAPAASAAMLPLAHATPLWQTPGRMAEEWGRSGRYVFSTLFLVALLLKTVPRAEPSGRRLVLAVVAVHIMLVIARVGVYGEISSRYLAIPAALCIPWAAAGLRAILSGLPRRVPQRRRLARAALWAVVLGPLVFYLLRLPEPAKEPLREAGQWLYRHAGPEDTVLAHRRLGQVMFYAGRTYPRDRLWALCETDEGWDQLAGRLRNGAIRWFVDAEGSHRGELDEPALFRRLLLDERPAFLRPVFESGAPGQRARVFECARE